MPVHEDLKAVLADATVISEVDLDLGWLGHIRAHNRLNFGDVDVDINVDFDLKFAPIPDKEMVSIIMTNMNVNTEVDGNWPTNIFVAISGHLDELEIEIADQIENNLPDLHPDIPTGATSSTVTIGSDGSVVIY